MGHDDDLRFTGKLAHHRREAVDVGIVERRVDFVEQVERRRTHADEREDQRGRGHRTFAAGERGERRHALSGRLHRKLNARLRKIVRIRLPHARFAAGEQAREGLGEGRTHLRERDVELLLRRGLDLLDRRQQRVARLREIVELFAKKTLALGEFFAIGFRVEVDVGSQAREFFPQARQLG